jgi:hypothetical protein
MKRGPTKNTLAFRALMSAEEEQRKLTLEEAILIQGSRDYSRFSIGGDILTPDELIEYQYQRMLEKNARKQQTN